LFKDSRLSYPFIFPQSNLKGPAAEITKDVTVPLKYHNAISQQGSFFRTLRNFGVFVDHSALPTKSGIPSRPPAARIDEAEAGEPEWEIVSNYQDTDTDEGDSTWTLKAKDQVGMERAEELIQEAINYASTLTHVGFLTLPDRSLFPKIVGTKGANVSRLRNETGADIIVSRENNTITITGVSLPKNLTDVHDSLKLQVLNPMLMRLKMRFSGWPMVVHAAVSNGRISNTPSHLDTRNDI